MNILSSSRGDYAVEKHIFISPSEVSLARLDGLDSRGKSWIALEKSSATYISIGLEYDITVGGRQ